MSSTRKQELIILTGPPATGKSIWARAWVAEDPEHRVWIADNQETAAKVAYEAGRDIAFETNQPNWSEGLRRRATKIMHFSSNGIEIEHPREGTQA